MNNDDYNVGLILFALMAYAGLVLVTSIIGGGILLRSICGVDVWVGSMIVAGVHGVISFALAAKMD